MTTTHSATVEVRGDREIVIEREFDAPPALDLVAPVVDAVGDRTEVFCDGGVRRGSDVLKAIALGARACLIGRAYLYGLAAAGELGVDTVIAMFDADLRRTMSLLGVNRVDELTSEYVERISSS